MEWGCVCPGCKRRGCQEWDSNPRLQGRLRPERSALDRSAILTAGVRPSSLASQASGAHARAQADLTRRGARAGAGLAASGCSSCGPAPPRPEPARRVDVERLLGARVAPGPGRDPRGTAQHARPGVSQQPLVTRSARDGRSPWSALRGRVSSPAGAGVQRVRVLVSWPGPGPSRAGAFGLPWSADVGVQVGVGGAGGCGCCRVW